LKEGEEKVAPKSSIQKENQGYITSSGDGGYGIE
jgi:hypothetical protein